MLSVIAVTTHSQAGKKQKLEWIFYFYPKATYDEPDTKSATLAIQGHGHYLIESRNTKSPVRSCKFRIDQPDTVLGFQLDIPARSPSVIKLYSLSSSLPSEEKAHPDSKPPDFVCQHSSISQFTYSARELRLVKNRTAPVTQLRCFQVELGSRRDSGKMTYKTLKSMVFATDRQHFHPVSIFPALRSRQPPETGINQKKDTTEEQIKMITEAFTELTITGKLLLFHLLGGDFKLAAGFKSSGMILEPILKKECITLALIGDFSTAELGAIATYINWLNTKEFDDNSSTPFWVSDYNPDTGDPVAEAFLTFLVTNRAKRLKEKPLLVNCLRELIWKTFTTSPQAFPANMFAQLVGKKILTLIEIMATVTGPIKPDSTTYRDLKSFFMSCTEREDVYESFIDILNSRLKNTKEQYTAVPTKAIQCTVLVESANQQARAEKDDINRTVSLDDIRLRLGKNTWQPRAREDTLSSAMKEAVHLIELGYETATNGLPEIPQAPFPITEPIPLEDYPYNSAYNASVPEKLRNEFMLLKRLGSGGEAQCYLVAPTKKAGTESASPLALKLVANYQKPEHADYKEVGLLKIDALRHPYGVQVHKQHTFSLKARRRSKQAPQYKRWHYQLQAFCPGGDLSSWIKEHGRLTGFQCWAVNIQLLDYILSIHSRQIAHRDIKPSNIFIDADGFIRIGDFGISEFYFGSGQSAASSVTGTVAYSGGAFSRSETDNSGGLLSYDPFTMDLQALGTTLYNLATGTFFYHPELLQDPQLRIYSHIEYIESLCQNMPHGDAVRSIRRELHTRYQELQIPEDERQINFISLLLCSHLNQNHTNPKALKYFADPYVVNPPQSTVSHTADTVVNDQPAVSVYRPEQLLSDHTDILRPTLMHALVRQLAEVKGTGQKDRKRLIAMESNLRSLYFYQPLPQQQQDLKHACLMGYLLKLSRKATWLNANDKSGDNWLKKTRENYGKYHQSNGVDIAPLMALIEQLEAGEPSGNYLRHLYQTVLKGCSLIMANPAFKKAAESYWQYLQHQYPDDDRMPPQEYFHIIDTADPATLSDNVSGKVVLIKVANNWGVLVPKVLM